MTGHRNITGQRNLASPDCDFASQDGNFDLPDRTFHSVENTWRLASSESTTDVKELIPDLFSTPEVEN